MRRLEVSEIRRTPVARAIRPAASSARPRGGAAQHQHGVLAAADGIGGRAHGLGRGARRGVARRDHGRRRARWQVRPGGVGRQDQRGNIARLASRDGDGLGRVGRDRASGERAPHPMRHGPRHSLDITGQRCVVLHMIGGMIAHDIDHGRARALGVMQVGQAIAQARPQVQQRGGGLVGHARITVGGAGHDTFEQAQHAAHVRLAIQRRHKVHLGRARIGKADVHIVGKKGIAKTVSAVHRVSWLLYRVRAGGCARADRHDR